LNFTGWLAILLIILVLTITTYCFLESCPKDGRPMDIELPSVHGLGYDHDAGNREIKIDLLRNGKIRIGDRFLSADLLSQILKKAVQEYGKDIFMHVRAEKNCLYKDVCPVINAIKDSGRDIFFFDVLPIHSGEIDYIYIRSWYSEDKRDLIQINVKKDRLILNDRLCKYDDLNMILQKASELDHELKCFIIPDSDITVQRLVDIIYLCHRCSIFPVIVSEEKAIPNEDQNKAENAN